MNIASIKPTITRREIEGVLNCLLNGELTKGNSIKEFESIILIIEKKDLLSQ